MKKLILLIFGVIGLYTVNAQNPIFSEDFSTFTWTKQTLPGGISTDSFQRYTTMHNNTIGIPSLNSSTSNNGWMIFDSDGSCSGNQHVRAISPSFDCSSTPSVQLCFQQWYRRFYDSTFVDVSNDGGLTWRSFYVNNDFNYPQSSASQNPNRVCLDITSAAANQPNVKIAFRFKSIQSMSTQAGCAYAWSIDDVLISNGLTPNTSIMSNVRSQTNYYTPLKLVQPILFGAQIENQSLVPLTTMLHVEVALERANGDILLFKDSTRINSLTNRNNIYFTNTFTPTKIGHYKVRYFLSIPNNQGTDERLTDFYVTEDFLGKSNKIPTAHTILGTSIPASVGGTFDQTKVGNLFYYEGGSASSGGEDKYCHGITFGIKSPSNNGTGVGVGGLTVNTFLSKWIDANSDTFIDDAELEIVATGSVTMPMQMLTDSVYFFYSQQYDLITNSSTILEQNTYYVYGVEYTEPYSTTQIAQIVQGSGPEMLDQINPLNNQLETGGLLYQIRNTGPAWFEHLQQFQEHPLCIYASISSELDCPRTTSIGSTDSDCGSNGTGALVIFDNPTIGSVTTPNQYRWAGPNGFTSNSSTNITGLPTGTYLVTTTQPGLSQWTPSCVFIDTLEIELNPWNALANITPATCGQSNGRIEIQFPFGTNSNLSFLWSNGETTRTITGLPPGNYRLTLTDGICTSYKNYRVNHNAYTNWFTPALTNSFCNQNNGRIELAFNTTLTPPLNIVWSNGQTTSIISGLAPGGYTVTVTGANNCVVHRNIEVFASSNCSANLTGKVLDVSNNPRCIRSSLHRAAKAIISLYDLSGNVISRTWTNTGLYYNEDYSFSVSASGTYIVRIDTFSQANDADCGSLWNSSNVLPFCGSLSDTIVLTLGTAQTRDFFVIPTPNQPAIHDLALYINSSRANARPVVNQNYFITVQNLGNQSENGTVVFTLDSLMNNVTNIGQGGFYNSVNRTVQWSFQRLAANDYLTFSLVMDVDTFANMGSYVINRARVTLSGSQDLCIANNSYAHQQLISNSYDPNDKSVSPPGPILPDSDPTLTYTIRFQNTGNDTAYIVRVKDTLDASKFELNSIVPISSSHSYRMSLDRNILTFTFANINLVDSFTNEPASNGYIQFSIRRKPTLMIGESIQNRAAIYFDYNRPIITNTASTSIVLGIGEVLFPNSSKLQIFPNPTTGHCIISGMEAASQIEVFDLLGKLVYSNNGIEQFDTNGQSQIDLSSLPQGVYIVKAGRAYGKLVKM